MALIKPSTPFDAIKRKFAKSDEIHFRNRKADNATISVRMKHPYNGGNSANQIAHRAKFKSASDAVKAFILKKVNYLAKNLHVSKKSSTFAGNLRGVRIYV